MPPTRNAMGKWPKALPTLTSDQLRIRDEFMRLWHEELPRYGIIERFNHGYAVRHRPPGRIRTLEIGAGLGAHLEFEDVAEQDYYALELRSEMAMRIRERCPAVKVIVGDCQQRLDFDDAFFDRVIAIHVLEHLPNLPAALREIHRTLRPGGTLSVVIPCEGGYAYQMARNISARRLFERHFHQSYDWLIASEHINMPLEIAQEVGRLFEITHRAFFPLSVPSVSLNLCIGLTCRR